MIALRLLAGIIIAVGLALGALWWLIAGDETDA